MGRLRWAGVCSGARSAPLRVCAPRKTLRSSCSLEDEGTSAANASIRCGFHECKHSARGRGVAHNPRLPLSREGDHEVVVGEFQRQSYFPTNAGARSAPLRVCAPRKTLRSSCSLEDEGTSAANASIRCGFHECKHSARGRDFAPTKPSPAGEGGRRKPDGCSSPFKRKVTLS